MKTFSRRRAMTIMAAGGAGAALTNLVGGDEVKATTEEQAATAIPIARAFAGKHQPKPLPFDAAKLSLPAQRGILRTIGSSMTGSLRACEAVWLRPTCSVTS